MFLCCMATTFAQFSGSGSGTYDDPYLILNPIQLNQLRNYLNKYGVYFKLMANIDLTEFIEDENPTQGWQPIGTASTPFKGTLDGNGKTISGLWINRSSSDYVGLFGCTNGATIAYLTLKGSSVKGRNYVSLLSAHSEYTTIGDCNLSASLSGDSYVGGCVGWGNSNQITKVSSTVDVTSSGSFAGGIIGYAEGVGSISENRVTCNNVSGGDFVGGVCGANRGTIPFTTCHVEANVNGGTYVGGVVGQIDYPNSEGNMTSCSFCGDINGSFYVGGICGKYASSATMKGCYAVAHVLASGNKIGGLVGETYGTYNNGRVNLLNNYFSGSVSGAEEVGGLIGHAYNGKTQYCYANTIVSGKQAIGGLIGKAEGQKSNFRMELISNVAICSSVKATGYNVGRIFGDKGVNVTIGEIGTANENKAWNGAIVINAGVARDIYDNEQNGTSVSKTTLELKATYVAMGFDFDNIWDIQETECYPYMKSQTAPPVITSQLVSGVTTISGKCVDGGTVTLEVDGVTQQMVSTGHEFSFNVSPLQAGHEVRISAKAEGKEQSYYTTEVVAYLGKGTEDDPYQVYTASDLTGVYRKGYFKLMNDIDLTSYINQFSPSEGWESIGREGSETIHFDGDGHKITGLWCNSTRDNTGLFSCFANGTIKNLTVETAKNKQVKGGANTGILIGKMINGTIVNCRVSGSVADRTPVGGIVGLFDGGTISRCQANVTINTTLATSYVGGLVGVITGGTIDQSFTEGTLTATGTESYVGGLVGNNSATITNCYSNVKVNSSYNAAGIVAFNYGVVDKCYATGNLFSSNYAAGIIGYNDGENAIVKNCVAMNNKIDVTYESQQQQQSGGYGQRIIGGIKNGAPAPELNNYALKTMQVSVNNVPQKVYDDIMNGVGKSASDLLQTSTYQELGWNFTDTWTINENENYPLLKNNTGIAVEPGEDPNPDPEPILTDDDKIVVPEVTATKGQQVTIGIGLENKTTDLTAYQFDLILPDGVSLSLNDNGNFLVTKTSRYEDDSQTLSVSKQDGNTYRFVCFSLLKEIITGTSGAILNVSLTIGASVNIGSYEATITNIVVTRQDGTQMKLNDSKFNIIVTNVIMGDANGDGEVNVSDIVEIVNYIMGKPSAIFVQAAADLNGDGEINVTDIVKVVSIIMDTNSNSAPLHRSAMNGNLTLSGKGLLKTAMVQHAEQFTAAQFDIILADGQDIDDISLNSNSDHYLTWKMTKEGTCRVLVYSLTNSVFDIEGGELMSISLSGVNGRIAVENMILVSAYNNATGISKMTSDKSAENWYTLDGRKMDSQPSKKGVYIKNGKKLVVK